MGKKSSWTETGTPQVDTRIGKDRIEQERIG